MAETTEAENGNYDQKQSTTLCIMNWDAIYIRQWA